MDSEKVKVTFNHFFSLGCACYSAMIGIDLDIRKFAGPFDICAGNLAAVEDCLDNDFANFLDRSMYAQTPFEQPSNSHVVYGPKYFAHRNPLGDQSHYDYYVRAVNRFRESLTLDLTRFFMFTTFPVHPGHMWSQVIRQPDFDLERIQRIVEKIRTKSKGKNYFLVWNILLGRPSGIEWTEPIEGCYIVNVSTLHGDFGGYNSDPGEKQRAVDVLRDKFKLVDPSQSGEDSAL
jgi:hypothetical protein